MNRRLGAVALIAIAVVLVLIGVLNDAWLTMRDREIAATLAIGLREVTVCAERVCESATLKRLPVGAAFSMSGNVAFFGGVIAAALGALAAGLALGNVQIAGGVSPARLAVAMFVVTLFAAFVFLMSSPDELPQLRSGTAGPLTMAGCVVGAIGSVLLALDRRDDAPWLAPGPLPDAAPRAAGAPSMSPACPECTAPLEWRSPHQRWYCASCRAYPSV